MFKPSHPIKVMCFSLLLVSFPPDASWAQNYSTDNYSTDNYSTENYNTDRETLTSTTNTTVSALLTRHQQRMDILEAGLKEVRGLLENDLREISMKVQQLDSSVAQDDTSKSADMQEINDKLERLTDMIAMTNRRMERTLEITSDTEFRLLRLEKRMQALLSFGSDSLANMDIGQDTNPAKPRGDVVVNRNDGSDGTTWSVDEQALANKLQEMGADNLTQTVRGDVVVPAEASEQPATNMLPATTNMPNDAGAAKGADTAASQSSVINIDSKAGNVLGGNTAMSEGSSEEPALPAKPQILPDVSPEEQFKFALGRALQNDLETAAAAFVEFKQFNQGHQREADAVYWLGRIQFMRQEYGKAALTLSEFNSDFPGDARLDDTTMWIAESVSHFAPPDQACVIYQSLLELFDFPPEVLLKRLATLRAAANCGS